MFLYIPNESSRSRRIRYARWWLRYWMPWRLRLAFGRLKLSGFIPIPLPYLPYLAIVPTISLMSQLEYHERHCDLSYFTGYCPNAGIYWSLPVNYCPLCTLDLARVRGYRLTANQIVIIEQSQRMTGPIPRPLHQADLVPTPPREHIFPPMVAYCPVPLPSKA
jgi:hypothetical protein